MSDDLELDNEAADMEKLRTFRRIVLVILRKYIPWALLLGVFCFAGILGFVGYRVKTSKDRYEAATSLIYSPKQNTKIRTMDGQEVLRVLSRRSVLRKLSDALQLSADELGRLGMDVTVEQNQRQKNLFLLVTRAPTHDEAVKKVNTFADLCMKEYVAYRMADLETWMDTILIRKKELQDQITKLEEKETQLSHKYGVTSPESEADRMSRVIGDRRSALVEARLHLTSAELKKRKLEKELSNISSNVVENADSVRAYLERQIKNESELTDLRHVYGEDNPRYKIAVEKRNANILEFKEFLERNGIKDTSGLSFTKYVGLQEELRDADARVDVLKQSVDALDRERENLEQKLQSLLNVLPEFERNSRQRDNLRHTLDGLEDTLADVRYLESTSGADLTQIEPAQSATGKVPFGAKSISLSLMVTAMVVCGLLLLVVILEFQYGVVSGSEEIAIHPEVRPLGTLPAGDRFKDEASARKICGSIFYLYHRECAKGLVYVGMLPGSELSAQLESVFNWNFGMGGEKVIVLNIVNALDFEEPENAEFVGLMVKTASEAWLPVIDVTALSPGEMEMLESSVKILRSEYDTVFVKRNEPMHKGEIFLTQIFGICDRILLFVGAKRSKRSDLRAVIETDRANQSSEILAVVTGMPSEGDKNGGS